MVGILSRQIEELTVSLHSVPGEGHPAISRSSKQGRFCQMTFSSIKPKSAIV